MKRNLFVVLVALALTACQSQKYYEGEEKRLSEEAVFFVAMEGEMNLFVISINGKPERFAYKKRVHMLPGKYSFELRSLGFQRLDSTGKPDPADKTIYQASLKLDVDGRAGYTYMFQSDASVANRRTTINANTRVCAYEELHDDPKSRENWTKEFRVPGPNAKAVSCSRITIQ